MDFFINYYVNFLIDYQIPYSFGFFLWHTVSFLIVAILMLIIILIFVWAERKILALFTVRKGPNRVGLCGCLQTIADAFKLLFKEDIIPYKADKFLFWLAPILVFTPVMFAWFLLPLSSSFLPIKTDVGILLFIAVMLIPALGILTAGYASNNKYSLIGALRACSQIICYEIPLIISVMSVVVLTGSMSLRDIILMQSQYGLFSWFFLPCIIGFVVFFISALAEMNRTPFDFPEAERELVAGYNTEYSGMKFAMFFLAEYASTFIICAFAVCLFFGGYNPPIPFYISDLFNQYPLISKIVLTFEQAFWLILKTSLMIFIVIWIRATLPRFRVDLLMNMCWKYLIPVSIFNLLLVCVIKLGGYYVL